MLTRLSPHRPVTLTLSTTTEEQSMDEDRPGAATARSYHPTPADMSSSCASTSGTHLKRAASESTFESDGQPMRKRLKEDSGLDTHMLVEPEQSRDSKIADHLSEELQCGCCSELVYRPVLVMPCQHFFCGRSVDESLIPLVLSTCLTRSVCL